MNSYAFFGTPEFAAIILEKLVAADMKPALVVCNPDQPVGRKKIITPPPAKMIAQKHNITVLQPVHLDTYLFANKNFDFFVVAAYGKIIPKKILDMPKLGTLGVHPSLLPKYRGATPIQSVILNGETETGVSIFMIDEQVDHGPVIAERKIAGVERMNYETLHNKLAETGAELLIEVLPEFVKSTHKLHAQNESEATFTKKFEVDDAYVDLTKDDAKIVERKVRALNPEPGVWTFEEVNGKKKRMKILEAELQNGKLKLKEIQWEGKKPETLT